MTDPISEADRAKYAAAKRAAELVETDMRVGLGTGSTAAWLVRCLGKRVRDEGLIFRAVATSRQTAGLARAETIDMYTLDQMPKLDLTIDGVDEFDPQFNLIKGAGGALLQEKIVAMASARVVVITDASKKVDQLGAVALPVEVLQFGWQSTRQLIISRLAAMDLGEKTVTRRLVADLPFVTDEGNFILDLQLAKIQDATDLELQLNNIPGVVENGLFIDTCNEVVIGHADGSTTVYGSPA